jgi:hypothetical protein
MVLIRRKDFIPHGEAGAAPATGRPAAEQPA